MPPPDESTSLLPEARPLKINWRQKCCKFLYWSSLFVYVLLLSVDVVWSVFYNVNQIANVVTTGFPTTPAQVIVLNGMDTLICWIFLVIVARSPRFVGCSTIIKNLIRLPKFWTLVFLLLLYILGSALTLLLFNSRVTTTEVSVTESVLNVFTKVILVGVLNHVQLRNVARSTRSFKYRLLKGTLVVTCFSQFFTLISVMGNFYFSFLQFATDTSNSQHEDSFGNPIMKFLLLPVTTRTIELMWTKILQDNKCIIGNNKSNKGNRFTRQNPRISTAIEIIWKTKFSAESGTPTDRRAKLF